MKKAICLILSLILAVSVMPLTAYAESTTVLTVSERYESSNELSWQTEGAEYDGTLIERSSDGITWTELTTVWCGGSYDYYVDAAKKTVLYYRVTCFNDVWNDETSNYDRTYAQPSNTVEVYPLFDYIYSYTDTYDGKAVINWSIGKESKNLIDGFEVFCSVNGAVEKCVDSVLTSKYSSKTDYDFNYKVTVKSLPKYVYSIEYIVKPYFSFNGKKYYINRNDEKDAYTFVSNSVVKTVTKRKKVILKFKDINGVSGFKVKYRKYNLKSGKNYKAKTKTVSGTKLTLKADTKYYGYTFEVYPVINGKKSESCVYFDSHDAFTLMNSVARKKAKPIKVINTRGKKPYTDWSYKLTKADRKTIKAFFYKKYKGKYPSRAEMAYYALEWINKKIKYDYDYVNGDLRYVDAIFNKKKGQCLQYNGAYAAVLTYLGYEARVIEGYRMDSNGKPVINHFWCEVKLNGRWYLCETGNYGKNGYWQYFASLYRYSGGYAKYGKPAKD
ncbi:MAG: transglutaminase domain-containing protein [Eubacterium sp.]|nr:transglutaminase domain-containing protein [Eubacterium sp.]